MRRSSSAGPMPGPRPLRLPRPPPVPLPSPRPGSREHSQQPPGPLPPPPPLPSPPTPPQGGEGHVSLSHTSEQSFHMAPQAPEEEWEPLLPPPLPQQISGGNSSRLKLDMPSPFDGDKKKTKSFLRKLHLYFAADLVLFASTHNRVLVTLSLCSIGPAETWAEIAQGAFDRSGWPT